MVKKWFTFIGKEIRGLHEAAYLLAIFAFLSQLLALVRDKLLAYYFGAGPALDIYYASFRIPDLIFASIGSLVSASILLPYFIDRFSASRESGRAFSNSIFTVFFAIMAVVSLVVFFLAPKIVPILLPGFANDPALPDLILSLRIMLFSPFFLGLSNLFSSLTQMNHRFLVYAASPLVYNIGIILGVLVAYPLFGIWGLAIGVAVGAFMHMGVQIPFLAHEKILPSLTLHVKWEELKYIALVTLPRAITLSANQIASFALISLASLMVTGSISIYNFAFNLQSVPLSLIGISYSSAVFPTLSRLLYDKNTKEFISKMIEAAQHIIFWSMPLAVLFIVLRAQIVRTVLGAGAFDWADTRLTAAALALFTLSTIGQSLVVLFIRAFYAEGKTAKPLILNIISALVMVFSGYGLVKLFFAYPTFRFFIENLLKVDGQKGTSVLVLALAFSIGALVNLALHWWFFERSYKGFSKPVFDTLFHSFSASVIMGYAAYLALRLFAYVFPLTKVWGVFLQGLCAGIFGIIVGVAILALLKNKELSEVLATLHKRIWKSPMPPAEVEHL